MFGKKCYLYFMIRKFYSDVIFAFAASTQPSPKCIINNRSKSAFHSSGLTDYPIICNVVMKAATTTTSCIDEYSENKNISEN